LPRTKEIFLERLKFIGYSQKTFAEYIGRSEDALKRWKDDSIPQWAWLIIDLIEENKDYKNFFQSQKKINELMKKYTS